jgi:hypothetical protein
MRVLIVTNHYRRMGGTETVVAETAALLTDAGHEPVVFAVDEPSDRVTSHRLGSPADPASSGATPFLAEWAWVALCGD